jgi:thiol-disulfide isomerase/thioredoxin
VAILVAAVGFVFVFGVGVGMFYARSSAFISPAFQAVVPRENAHNNYLQILAELGGQTKNTVIEELAASLSGRVRVAKLNLDRSPQSFARRRIQGVPTLIVFKGGHEVARMVGARGRSELMRALADVE